MREKRSAARDPQAAHRLLMCAAMTLSRTIWGIALVIGCADPNSASDQQAVTTRYGVDYAWARPSPSSLAADGFTFAARYLSYDTSGKNLSHGEADALIAAGLDVAVVWEQNATDALDGYSRGVQHAQAAAQQAAADGQPGDRPIYFAVDFDATPGDQAAIDSYLDGVASVIGRDRTGLYGGYWPLSRAFDDGKITWGWQTYAWSGGNWDSRAQLRQIQNGILNDQADKDEAVADDFGQWPIDLGPPPAPPPLPTVCGWIEPGHGLSAGQSWSSCDDRFTLAMQGDRNLVLYSLGVPMWATGTNARGGQIAIMQGDGNFVEYSDHSKALFATGTWAHPGARLAIQDDGNMVVYEGGTPLWASNTAGMPPSPTTCGRIDPGHGLAVGEAIASCDGHHALVMQGDGNLVLYHGNTATWASHTYGSDGRRAVMQGDGNLVVYGAAARWASGTNGHPGAWLAVQDDGNVVVYVGTTPIWATGTNGH